MKSCSRIVRWDGNGIPELTCGAGLPCPYHDYNGLTADQRRDWRRTWAMTEVRK